VEKGAALQSVLERIAQVRSRLVQIVGMTTLKYLQLGGRIGGAAKWASNILNVKPLVSINHTTGSVEPIGLVRTSQAMMNMLYNKFFGRLGQVKNLKVAVLHGNSLDNARALAERIQSEFHPRELLINITGPVLGINTGPGALALCGFCDE